MFQNYLPAAKPIFGLLCDFSLDFKCTPPCKWNVISVLSFVENSKMMWIRENWQEIISNLKG